MSSDHPDSIDADGVWPPASKAAGAKKAKLVKTGVAVGIGSAAIVAALLYANRAKRND